MRCLIVLLERDILQLLLLGSIFDILGLCFVIIHTLYDQSLY